MRSVFTDFSAGELSEKVKGRFDLPVYRKGCLTLENMMVTSLGMVTKRPGTIYQGVCDGVTNESRIIPYIYSPTESYILELVAGKLQVWRNGSKVVETASPSWTADQLFDIQYAQDFRGCYFTHHSFAPCALIRTAQDSFSFGAINWLYYPGGTLTSHATQNAQGNSELVCTANINTLDPDPNQQGRLRVKYSTGQYDEYTFTGWSGTTFTGIVPGLARDYDSGDSVIIEHAYDSDNATTPFSGANNYPKAISIYAGRFWFFNSRLDRQRVWASKAFGDVVESGSLYLDMRMYDIVVTQREEQTDSDTWAEADEPETETVTYTRSIITADSGIQFDIASDQNDAILWAAPGKDLFIGTTASEWIIPRDIDGRNPRAILNSRSGSAEIQPHFTWDILPFIQSSKKQLRAYQYSEESGGYKPPDLTRLADHVFGSGITEFDVQKEPRCMMYFPRSDGQLAVLTYEPDAGVLAWQRWMHSDETTTFISCAVVPEAGTDTVYVTVKRGSNYYLEKFADPFPDSQDNIQFLDSMYDVTADYLNLMITGTLTGATWLSNLTITVVEDGAEAGTETVDASGDVNLSAYTGGQVYVGLPYTHKLETMPIANILETPFPMDDKRIVRGIFRLYHSLTFKTVYNTWAVASAVDMHTFGTTWETDDVEVEYPGDVAKDATFRVVGQDAYPLSIQAMMLEVDPGMDEG